MAVVQIGCKPNNEPSHAEPSVGCPEPATGTIAEGSLGAGSPELCEQLANTYALVTEAHAGCETNADCGSYPEIGLCGGTLNTKVPRESLAKIHDLQVGYGCPMPMAKCMPPAEIAVCVANVCERG